MKPIAFRSVLCLALAAVMLLTLCACGDTDTDQTHTIRYKDITDYCRIEQEEGSDTYSCTVIDVLGATLFYRERLEDAPKAEAVDDSLLKVTRQIGTLAEGSWAVYCNVENGRTSQVFYQVLATKGTTVAYTEYLTGAHQIFVQNAMDETVYFESYTLEDADEGNAVLGGKLNEDGDLEIAYLCKEETKTIVVEMPE